MAKKRVAYKAKLIANSVERAVNKTTSELGLTSAQAFILGYLHNNRGKKICQKNIENNFNITHPTATGIIKRLEEKGFVTCYSSSEDRRYKLIAETEKAIALHNEVISQIEAVEQKALAGLTDEEQAQLHRLLDKVIAIVAPESAETKNPTKKGEDL